MIYFAENGTYFKIGVTKDPPGRANSTEAKLEELDYFAYMPGERPREVEVLGEFEKWCVPRKKNGYFSKERFTKEAPIFEYVANLLALSVAAPTWEEADVLPLFPWEVIRPEAARRRAMSHDGQTMIWSQMPPRERLKIISSDARLNSLSDEWYTPKEWIDLARAAMRTIDTDPATTPWVNAKFINAQLHYSRATNGLDPNQPWRGNVWLNPPYGKDDQSAKEWMPRLASEILAGNVKQAVTLLNVSAMSTNWFCDLVAPHVRLHFVPRSRIDFCAPSGKKEVSSSGHGSVLSYWGKDPEMFASVFSDGPAGQLLRVEKTVPKGGQRA